MPTLSGEQLGGLKSEVLAFLKKKKATVVEEEDWGLRKLAYPIRKKNTGFIILFVSRLSLRSCQIWRSSIVEIALLCAS